MEISFLIAGVQKGATTALHHYMHQHVDINLPEKKELHFFDDETIDWTNPPYDSVYHDCFTNSLQNNVLYGEATPIYTYWLPSMARIKLYNPNIRLIVSLRDPVARAYSAWRMIHAWGLEPLSFSQAIREGRERVANAVEIPGHDRLYSYVERGFYAEQILRMLNYFPREQILFLTSNELQHQPENVLNQVCDFLQIPKFRNMPKQQIVFSHKHINTVAQAPTSIDIEYLRTLFHEDLEQTQELIGCKIMPEFV